MVTLLFLLLLQGHPSVTLMGVPVKSPVTIGAPGHRGPPPSLALWWEWLHPPLSRASCANASVVVLEEWLRSRGHMGS